MLTVHDLMRRLHCRPSEFYQVLSQNFRTKDFVIASDRGALIAIHESAAPGCTATLSQSMQTTFERLHLQQLATPDTAWRSFKDLLAHPKLQDLETCPCCHGAGWMSFTTCTHCKGKGEHPGSEGFDPCLECQEWGEIAMPCQDTAAGAYACETCQGAGDAPKDRYLDKFTNIPLPDIAYCFGVDAKYARLLAQLPGAMWAPPQRIGEHDCGAVMVRFDQGWGAIMPLREWQSPSHTTKPATERVF